MDDHPSGRRGVSEGRGVWGHGEEVSACAADCCDDWGEGVGGWWGEVEGAGERGEGEGEEARECVREGERAEAERACYSSCDETGGRV